MYETCYCPLYENQEAPVKKHGLHPQCRFCRYLLEGP